MDLSKTKQTNRLKTAFSVSRENGPFPCTLQSQDWFAALLVTVLQSQWEKGLWGQLNPSAQLNALFPLQRSHC